MVYRCLRTLAVLALVGGLTAPAASAQPADSLLDGSFWKAQGLTTVLPAWTEHARTDEGWTGRSGRPRA